MRFLFPILLLLGSCLSGCASLKPTAFANGGENITFTPVDFFTGSAQSSGVMENRKGNPTARITTRITGAWRDSVLYLEQDLNLEGSEPNHRSWKLRRTGPHQYEATATGIKGVAKGELYGPYFTWRFRLQVSKKGIVQHVWMRQHMYVQPGGKSMTIRSILSKGGIRVAQIIEVFRKN
jgi:hypothetical protein